MRRIAAVEFRPRRVVPKYWWTIGIGAFAIALLALLTSPATRDAAAQAQCPFAIDFAGLPHGTILGEQYAAQGVHISATGNDGGPDALNGGAPSTAEGLRWTAPLMILALVLSGTFVWRRRRSG